MTWATEIVHQSIRRLSVKLIVTLVVTLVFLLSLFLISLIQLYYVNVEMKTILAEQQHIFVARVADELDQKLVTSLNFLDAGTRTIPPEYIGDVGKLEQWAAQRQGLRSIFSDIFVISPKGVVLVDSPPQGRHGIDVSDREYFRTTVQTRKPYISKPLIGKSSKGPVVSFSAPVLGKDGTVVAVLSATLNLLQSNFLGNLAEAKVGKGGSFAVFTRDRTIVISRDRSRILTQGPAPGVSPYFDHATSGLDGSEESINSRGLHAIFSYSQLKVVPWVLVASLPIGEAYAPIQAAQLRIVGAMLLLGVLVAPLVWLAVHRLYDPLRVALRETEILAQTDSLTGCYNRRYGLEQFEVECERAKRGGTVSICLADVDHFKSINDTFGHPAGDQVLKEIAAAIRSVLRVTDFVVRYGGEEFLLVFSGTPIQGSALIAERLRDLIEKRSFAMLPKDHKVTISMGLAEYRSGEGYDTTISLADRALYKAKAEGRNRICCDVSRSDSRSEVQDSRRRSSDIR